MARSCWWLAVLPTRQGIGFASTTAEDTSDTQAMDVLWPRLFSLLQLPPAQGA